MENQDKYTDEAVEVEEQENNEDATSEEESSNEEEVVLESTDEQQESVEGESISPVQELEAKLEESNNRFLRLQADYENFRRRTRQEKEADAKYRSQRLAEELLPAMDNFERALNIQVESEEATSLLEGMEMVYRQLKDALKKEGVEPVESVGMPFDPHFHQAVMQVEEEGYDSNVVVEELQKGYKIKDRVIRPAMVKVNQ
ncbi:MULTISPECIES: nucleotide exchange factor GrpE [Bacillaceae]|uniref:nucleotide exchange factor GrpE n=1 Tax=Bacillaceae TaxID=186817 RepID=UPI001F2AC597|nr:nucleotide exchange factor GrpE [Litchfieldia alkalitelluris]